MLSLTDEERQILIQILMTAPFQGTLKTLPEFLSKLTVIIHKLESVQYDSNT